MFSKILYLLSAGYFASVIYKNYNLLGSIPRELSKASFLLIVLALLLQVVKYLVLAYNFYINFNKTGVNFKYVETLKATFVYIYVCIATPFIGAGGLLAFVNYAGHKKVSKIKVAAGSFLTLLADYLGFFIVVIFSLIFFKSTIEDFPVNYLISMLVFGAVLLLIVFLSIFKREMLTFLLKKLQDLANFFSNLFKKQIHFDDDWSQRNVDLAHECFVDIKKDPYFYVKSVGIGLIMHLLNIATFAVVGLSFSENLNLSKLVSSYVVLNTLETISPTPNGIGIIESFVPEFMSSIGVDFANALVVVTIFRFIYLYIPLFIGFYFSYKIFNGKK
jgi:uncharacterized protein (TIRG00374 family)